MKRYLLYIFLFIVFISGLAKLYSVAKKQKEDAQIKKIVSENRMHGGDALVPEFNEETFSESRKVRIKKFVANAAKHLEKNDLDKALSDFCHDKKFVDGELYIFVYDTEGTSLAHGQQLDLVWHNVYDAKDAFGTYFVREIIDTAKKGKGWITYRWRGTAKVSYVQLVQKDGKSFVVGAGFYPISKKDTIKNLVREAVEHFNGTLEKGETVEEAFGELSYPLGKFILGDLYLFAVRFKDGKQMAQGDRPGLIGQYVLEYQDETGKFVNKEIIKKLKNLPEGNGIWEEYVSKKAPKVAYAEKVTDKKGNQYFIACGYYPDSNRDKVIELVKRGATYLAKSGVSVASEIFSDKRNLDYRYGDLSLVIYDYEGNCRAHGENPELIGRNRFNEVDEEEKYFIRDLIKKAKNGGGWADFKRKNSYFFSYVEPIKVGAEWFLIGSGLYPISKPEAMQLLVKGGAGYLRDNPKEKVFSDFVKRDGKFVKGDLELFVIGFNGICYAYGNNWNFILRNIFDAKDEDGRPFVKMFINTAKEGPGKVVFKQNGRLKTAYVMKVEKDDKQFVIGSSFFAS